MLKVMADYNKSNNSKSYNSKTYNYRNEMEEAVGARWAP